MECLESFFRVTPFVRVHNPEYPVPQTNGANVVGLEFNNVRGWMGIQYLKAPYFIFCLLSFMQRFPINVAHVLQSETAEFVPFGNSNGKGDVTCDGIPKTPFVEKQVNFLRWKSSNTAHNGEQVSESGEAELCEGKSQSSVRKKEKKRRRGRVCLSFIYIHSFI